MTVISRALPLMASILPGAPAAQVPPQPGTGATGRGATPPPQPGSNPSPTTGATTGNFATAAAIGDAVQYIKELWSPDAAPQFAKTLADKVVADAKAAGKKATVTKLSKAKTFDTIQAEITKFNTDKTNQKNGIQVTATQIYQVANDENQDKSLLALSVSRNLDAIKTGDPSKFFNGLQELKRVLSSKLRSADDSYVEEKVDEAIKKVKGGTPPAQVGTELANDPKFKIKSSAKPAGDGKWPAKVNTLAEVLVELRAKADGVKLTDELKKKQVEELLKGFEEQGYLGYAGTLVGRMEGEITALKTENADRNNESLSGIIIVGASYTDGPNGQFSGEDEPKAQEGRGSAAVIIGSTFKVNPVFGASVGAVASLAKADPLNGLPANFHYLGGKNKQSGSTFAMYEAAGTVDLKFFEKDPAKESDYDGLFLQLKLGIVDPDPRDDLSDGAVLGLAGAAYSIAKYSPIYDSPLGGYLKLRAFFSPSFSAYIAGAAGTLPEYNLTSKPESTEFAATDEEKGEEVVSKEIRVGAQWASNPDKPKDGHIVAVQGQYNVGEKTSLGAYITGQFYLNPTWVMQASARKFSLADGQTDDVALYGAIGHDFSARLRVSAFGSFMDRTKEEKLAKNGTAGVDVSGEPVPNDGVITDESGVSITQFGGELVYAAADNLRVRGIGSALRTNPQAGSLEHPEWRPYVGGTLTFTF